MASGNFVCKQFEISQQHSAMKVGTDSLILGSWALVEPLSGAIADSQYNVLDIGCGTGLLTLMLAQKFQSSNQVKFTAVEMDQGACIDAELNFSQCNWAANIQLVKSPIQDLPMDTKYQRIICNPPYFGAGQTIQQGRALARLQTNLDWTILAAQISQRLALDGIAELVFPFADLAQVKAIFAENNLTCIAELHIFPKSSDDVAKRVCIRVKLAASCGSNLQKPDIEKLVIYDEQSKYTEQYRALCRAYYLNF
ncbi:tRNA1(Val) (adenine(37)-N6)-methyltransferase [Catenovulum sp. SX2]|uniref:tRNA1(Val) (adenine(37)-N6)-methyltransferase n=1 Tax=Catenovulum sp. SX2 TaxID=3398614 RepID=UPI003F844781